MLAEDMQAHLDCLSAAAGDGSHPHTFDRNLSVLSNSNLIHIRVAAKYLGFLTLSVAQLRRIIIQL